MSRLPLPAVMMLFACEGAVTTPTDLGPAPVGCLDISPRDQDVGSLDLMSPPATPPTATVTLSNPCDAPVRIAALELRPREGDANSFELGDAGLPQVLAAGEQTDIQVTFAPTSVGTHSLDVLVDTDAEPGSADAGFGVTGQALGPMIEVSPTDRYDLGSPYLGCGQSHSYTIRNTGTSPLTLSAVEPDRLGDGFSLDLDPEFQPALPHVLGPFADSGQEYMVYLDYLPMDTQTDTAQIAFLSDDPVQPAVRRVAVGTGTATERKTESFTIARPLRDVLVVVDRREGMKDDNAAMIDKLDAFMAEARSADADLHLALASAEDGCILGSDAWIEVSATDDKARSTAAIMADLDRRSAPTVAESSLDLAAAALSAPATDSDGCNAGLLRDEARLDLVFAKRSPDPSLPSWSEVLRVAESAKSESDAVRIHFIGGVSVEPACEGVERVPAYYEAAIATGGVSASICSVDWPGTWADIGTRVMQRPNTVLPLRASPGTLEVRLDGVLTTTGWTHAWGAELHFDRALPPGTEVSVTYYEQGDCEG